MQHRIITQTTTHAAQKSQQGMAEDLVNYRAIADAYLRDSSPKHHSTTTQTIAPAFPAAAPIGAARRPPEFLRPPWTETHQSKQCAQSHHSPPCCAASEKHSAARCQHAALPNQHNANAIWKTTSACMQAGGDLVLPFAFLSLGPLDLRERSRKTTYTTVNQQQDNRFC